MAKQKAQRWCSWHICGFLGNWSLKIPLFGKLEYEIAQLTDNTITSQFAGKVIETAAHKV